MFQYPAYVNYICMNVYINLLCNTNKILQLVLYQALAVDTGLTVGPYNLAHLVLNRRFLARTYFRPLHKIRHIFDH